MKTRTGYVVESMVSTERMRRRARPIPPRSANPVRDPRPTYYSSTYIIPIRSGITAGPSRL